MALRHEALIGFFDGSDGAPALHRVYFPAGELFRRGFDVRLAPDLKRSTLADFDVVVVHRPYSPQLCADFLNAPRETRMVLTVDENFHATDAACPTYDEKVHNERLREGLAGILQAADDVIVANEQLHAYYKAYNTSMYVIADMIRPEFYNPVEVDRSSRDGVLIGWDAESLRAGAIERFGQIFSTVARTESRTRFLLLGGPSDMQDPGCECLDGVAADSRAWALGRLRFDIGVVPLESTDYNRFRSSLSCLEFACCKIPVVASDVARYSNLIEDGVTGYLISDRSQWADCLKHLIEAPEKRRRMGEAAYARAVERHGAMAIGALYEALVSRWLET